MPHSGKKWHLPIVFNFHHGSVHLERHTELTVPVTPIALPATPTQPSCISSPDGGRHKNVHVSFDLDSNQCLTYDTADAVTVHVEPVHGYISSTGKAPGEQPSRIRSISVPAIRSDPSGEELVLGWSRTATQTGGFLTSSLESGVGAM